MRRPDTHGPMPPLLITLREAGAVPSVLSPLPTASLFPVLMTLGISRLCPCSAQSHAESPGTCIPVLMEFGLSPSWTADGKTDWCGLFGGQAGTKSHQPQSCADTLTSNPASRNLVLKSTKAMGSMDALFIITHTQRVNLNVYHK